ncbi:sulfurtransferase [Amycolatopsis sp. H20-H5]|uniref:sulfurtransferase n=1 Tax=Amycolatopsis sp. H20-H5 TaxID=3046309 RepID=UPI002DB6FAAB|nr:sulfurtransferase [Amycolatopsis sp. H20-H5]MEC3973963.1 sulfurtransferase [Amycolatopsis sp. H20-H5]
MRTMITTTDLAALLGAAAFPPPVVLDVRWRLAGPPGADSYREGHLPGAVYVDLDQALAGEPGEGGRHPLPAPGDLQRHLRAAGVRAGHPVVVYDDADGSVAARAWWLLRWAGHTEVSVLDGGYAAWVTEGHPVSTDAAEPAEGDIVVEPGGMPVLDADQAARLARRGVLFDARARPRYAGETEPVDPRAGHIPGAVNAPFTGHLGEDGRWLPPGELAERFAGLGATAGKAVGAYCGSGVTASSVVLALEVAGHPEPAALYTGSWSHWSRDPARPAATGDRPG